MLIRLIGHTERAASLKAVLVLFLCLLPFNLFLFPARGQRLEAYLGYRANVLDARLYYTPGQAYRYFSDLGSPGRQLYAVSELTLDLFYPLLYGFFLSLLLAWIYPRLSPARRFLSLLPLLPLAGALADLGENLTITVLLLAYPIALYWLVYLANLFTLLKWLAALLSILLILLGAGAYVVIRFTKRKHKFFIGQ